MKDEFGLGQTSVKHYLSISRLSDRVKKAIGHRDDVKIDTNTAAGISTSDWEEDEQHVAGKELEKIY